MTPNVGSVSNGFYTAPANITAQETVVLKATSQADPTKYATVSLVLKPVATPTPAQAVSLTITPTTASLNQGQTATFTPTVSGSSNTSVVWSVNPQVGTVTSGIYAAPATLTSQQTVTVTATSAADPTKTASATVTLRPLTVTITPGSVSLGAGQSATFTAAVVGTGNTNVAWTLAPAVGKVVNGVYTAPATISTAQTLKITAISVVQTSRTASATISLTASPVAPPVAPPVSPPATPTSVSPATATIAPNGTTQFSVANLPSGTTVTWSLSSATGSITSAGVYTAPSTVATQTTLTISAKNASTNAVLGTASVTLTASPAPASATITLPIEVMGPNGYTTPALSFSIPQGSNLSGQLQLWLEIHGVKYDTEASVELNNSAWLPISTANVTLLGNAAAYGGIGGAFHTLQLTMNLPAGTVTAGTNTISFRFNGTDGVTSGFRVLGFNVQTAGTNLVPSSLFVQDDPDNWQPPSSVASDIAAGQTLWHTAALTAPGIGAIKAHCADCHSEDGRDLKYFNYSNNSIVVRSEFHGLTSAQGNQIASYIRSLNLPNPGRPWNPPYQPGPGLDSEPVSDWSAGAGLDAVLDNNSEMQPYLTPGGSTAGWAASAYLNPRELPISIQLPDWNAWLPQIHPMDAYSNFTASQANLLYAQLRTMLQPNSTTAYKNSLNTLAAWEEAMDTTFLPPLIPATYTTTTRQSIYAAALWKMVKTWELNQEFGLEGMPQVPFGSKANIRGWYGSDAFNTSPFILHMPAGPGLGNGSAVSEVYLSFIWYHVQLILNDGQGSETDNRPIDYGYVLGRIKDLSSAANDMPAAYLEMAWFVKALQEETLDGIGPNVPEGGWDPQWTAPEPLVDAAWDIIWTGMSPSTRTTLTQAYLQAWYAQASTYTPQQYFAGGWSSPTENPANMTTDFFQTSFGGELWYLLPRMRYIGVSPTLVSQMTNWAATIFPAGNWSLNATATCATENTCTSGY